MNGRPNYDAKYVLGGDNIIEIFEKSINVSMEKFLLLHFFSYFELNAILFISVIFLFFLS